MITIKDLIDNKTSYSTTRWGFVVSLIFSMVLIALTFGAFVLLRFFGLSTEGLFGGISTLLGIIVGLSTTAKALQGFEPKKDNEEEQNKDNEKNEEDFK